jgi:hypothetical protein
VPTAFEARGAFLLVSVYLLGGAILFALGMIGEYIGRIYDQVKARPRYVLKERSASLPDAALPEGRRAA